MRWHQCPIQKHQHATCLGPSVTSVSSVIIPWPSRWVPHRYKWSVKSLRMLPAARTFSSGNLFFSPKIGQHDLIYIKSCQSLTMYPHQKHVITIYNSPPNQCCTGNDKHLIWTWFITTSTYWYFLSVKDFFQVVWAMEGNLFWHQWQFFPHQTGEIYLHMAFPQYQILF